VADNSVKPYRKAIILLIILYILSSGLVVSAGSAYKQQAEIADEILDVLIINSYHQGLTWSNDIASGIIETLKKGNYNIYFNTEYLDWKNYPSEENIRFLKDYFYYKYSNKDIDVIITSDDAALKFALENRDEMFSGAPVVFCGVNQEGFEQITKGYDNLTGIIEEIDPTDTIKAALMINPSLKNIYVLFDNSESGLSTGKLVIDKIKALDAGLNAIPMNQMAYEDIIKTVAGFGKDDIVLITTYYSDVNGKLSDMERISREISRYSPTPVYHLYDMGLNNGAIGGRMMSGRLQGEMAAAIAIRILKGEDPNEIPAIIRDTTVRKFDFNQLKKFNIPLSNIPEGYEVINKPISIFEAYKTEVLVTITAFFALFLIVCTLLFYSLRIRKMKKRLLENNEELTQIYEELAASDEELKQQFDELLSVKEMLAKSEERFRLASDGSNAIIWDADLTTMTYHFSDKWYELLGYEKNEINEEKGGWKSIIHPDDALLADKARNEHLEGKTEFYNAEYRMRTKSGEYIWFNVRGKVLRDKNGKNIRFAGSLIDITENKIYESKLKESYLELESAYGQLAAAQDILQKQYDEILKNQEIIKATEDRMKYLAYHDILTGLRNKLALYEDAKEFLLSGERKAAVMFIDLDQFKYINDTMGHAFGDQLLARVSERLSSLLENNCYIYRLSGDEFIIIMQDIMNREEAESFTSRILKSMRKQFIVSDITINVSLSIGIAFYPDDGSNIDELLKCADIAMYKAKEAGRKGYVVYNWYMNEAITERMNIEKHLHTALKEKQFELHYQPQLDLHSNKISGVEALLRWNNPELGWVSPLKFIKVAEDSNLIVPLGYWVLKESCAFLKKLHSYGRPDITVSVNISVRQLLQSDFAKIVVNTLKYYQLQPQFLELEITETILIESFEAIIPQLKKLREIGIRIALDDFGKGYSSLSYLKQLPISTLKIDKSFISSISDNDDRSLLRHIITIGRCLGLHVVAEGVEEKEQLDFLIQNDCHKIQGYLFSKPVPENEIIKMLFCD